MSICPGWSLSLQLAKPDFGLLSTLYLYFIAPKLIWQSEIVLLASELTVRVRLYGTCNFFKSTDAVYRRIHNKNLQYSRVQYVYNCYVLLIFGSNRVRPRILRYINVDITANRPLSSPWTN